MAKPRKSKSRNWHAVNAQFRGSAGAIPDEKKEQDKKECRQALDEYESQVCPQCNKLLYYRVWEEDNPDFKCEHCDTAFSVSEIMDG